MTGVQHFRVGGSVLGLLVACLGTFDARASFLPF